MKLSYIKRKLSDRLFAFFRLGRFLNITPHRLSMLETAFQYAKNELVPGSYFEFGVARGLTFVGAYHAAKKYNHATQAFFAFDSFQGFPQLGAVDKKFERFSPGQESWSQKQFLKSLQKGHVPANHVQIVPGWFKDTLHTERIRALSKEGVCAAIVWIDCDLYESTSQVLTFIKTFLQSGTVLIFDDWFCYHADPEKGEQRALIEFLRENPEIQCMPYKTFGIVGNSFIVHKKDGEK